MRKFTYEVTLTATKRTRPFYLSVRGLTQEQAYYKLTQMLGDGDYTARLVV